jgi:hypothetical protein
MLGPNGTLMDPSVAGGGSSTHDGADASQGAAEARGASQLPDCAPDESAERARCMARVHRAAEEARVTPGPRAFNRTATLRAFWHKLFDPSVPPVGSGEFGRGGFGVTVPIPCCRDGGSIKRFAFKFTTDRLNTEFPFTAESAEDTVQDPLMSRYFLTQLTRPMPLNRAWIGMYALGTKDLLQFLMDGDHERGDYGTVNARKRLATRVTTNLLRGVRHLHRLGFVHRDIKPENIVMVPTDAGLTGKLIDFGMTTTLGAPAGFAGSYAYLSPLLVAWMESTNQRAGSLWPTGHVHPASIWVSADFYATALSSALMWDVAYSAWGLGTIQGLDNLPHGGAMPSEDAAMHDLADFAHNKRNLRIKISPTARSGNNNKLIFALQCCFDETPEQIGDLLRGVTDALCDFRADGSVQAVDLRASPDVPRAVEGAAARAGRHRPRSLDFERPRHRRPKRSRSHGR